MQPTRLMRIFAAACATAIAVDVALAYWWLTFGPFPESAWSA